MIDFGNFWLVDWRSIQSIGEEMSDADDRKRDILWEVAFNLYYDTYYEELLIARLLARWSKIEAVTKVLVAVTSASSAVAGWSLWNKENFRVIWAIFAGGGALLAIVSSALGVQTKLKEHASSKENFSRLRSEIEILRHRMKLNPQFNVEEANEKFEDLKRNYIDHVNGEEYDILLNNRLENAIQDQLNKIVKEG